MKKISWKLCICFFALCLGLVIRSIIFNTVNNKKEFDTLYSAGYVNRVDVGDYSLNVHSYGNVHTGRVIVGISGMRDNTFSVGIESVTSELANYNRIAVVDRAGYGMSDDTYEDQTVDRVVRDYRKALKNSGIDGPYVLLAHSYGSVYAKYWESTYPDEIEGIIFINPTQLVDLSEYKNKREYDPSIHSFTEAIESNIGLSRIKLSIDPYKPWAGIDSERREYAKALSYSNIYSFAMYSEAKESLKNMEKVKNKLEETDTPKLYIDSTINDVGELKEAYAFLHKSYKEVGVKNTETIGTEEINKILGEYKDAYDNYVVKYADMLGNTKLVNIPGYYNIYLQKPGEVAYEIDRFLESLE